MEHGRRHLAGPGAVVIIAFGLVLLFVYVPKVHAMPLGFITLSAVAMTIFAVTSLYGRFISFFEPPLGKHLVTLFVRKYH